MPKAEANVTQAVGGQIHETRSGCGTPSVAKKGAHTRDTRARAHREFWKAAPESYVQSQR